MTDNFTRWPECEVVESTDAKTTARVLSKFWISRFGAPRYMVTDQGSSFTGKVLEALARLWDVKRIRTSAYHPQTNGLEERGHRILADMMAKLLDSKNLPDGKWQQTLDDAMLARRVLVNRMTGFSPARLVLGDELVLPNFWIRAPTWRQWRSDNLVRFALADEIADEARRTMHKRQGQRDKDIDTLLQRMDSFVRRLDQGDAQDGAKAAEIDGGNKSLPNFRAGQYVRRWLGDGLPGDNEVLNAKLASRRWSTPWRVCEVIRGVAVLITKADDPLQVATVAAARVKRVQLVDSLHAKYEDLWRETMRQKEREKERRDIIREKMDWRYEEKDERDMLAVEKVLQVREKGNKKEVKVQWADGSMTWEPARVIKADAPNQWLDWKEKNSKPETKKARKQ
jgi:hypothetical protein